MTVHLISHRSDVLLCFTTYLYIILDLETYLCYVELSNCPFLWCEI